MSRLTVNWQTPIDKEAIEELKSDPSAFAAFLQTQTEKAVIYVLERLGRLTDESSREPLIRLLRSQNQKIRLLALKNLAKIGDRSLLAVFMRCASTDASTEVRREAVSALGRLRYEKAIPALVSYLQDDDPKVAMQAIRGLLVFSDMADVQHELAQLRNHPNELVREIVSRESSEVSTRSDADQKHAEFPPFLQNKVVLGDVAHTLQCVPDESVHLTFTSPPYYNARDYSIYPSYEAYLTFLEKVFSEVHRVTKEGRFFVLNTSPIIIPRVSRSHASKRYPIPYDIHPRLVKMGWEFIDDIVWAKPEPSVKNRNAGFLQHRKPLGYKPNAVTEMLMVYRKKTDKLIDWNMRQYSWDTVRDSKVLGEYETTNIWQIEPTFDRVHSAVFPTQLCERVVQFYSFVGDLVFDPFAGSGTLGRAALGLGRNFLLAEQNAQYVERIRAEFAKNRSLFSRADAPIQFLDIQQLSAMAKAA